MIKFALREPDFGSGEFHKWDPSFLHQSPHESLIAPQLLSGGFDVEQHVASRSRQDLTRLHVAP